MANSLVSLLVGTVLAAQATFGQPGFGFPGLGFPGAGLPGQQPAGPELTNQNQLTCIGADALDPQGQIRMTLTPMVSSTPNPLMNPLGLGLPGMGLGMGLPGMGAMGGVPAPGMIDRDLGVDWQVSGMFFPSSLIAQKGIPPNFPWSVAVFEYGRTHGTCQNNALGRVLPPRSRAALGGAGVNPLGNPFGAFGGLGGPLGLMDPFLGMAGMGMGLGPFGPINPLLGGLAGQQQMMATGGRFENTMMISPAGPTMRTAILRDLSFNQLVGGSIAVCQDIQGEACLGFIPYCCTIAKDPLPADQVYLNPGDINGGMGGVGGVGLGGVGGVGLGGVGGALGAGLGAGAGVAALPLGGAGTLGGGVGGVIPGDALGL